MSTGSDVRVYRVATQGKEPGEHLWVSVYKVSFSKDGTTWSFYSENGVVKVTEISMNDLSSPNLLKFV